MFRISRTGQWPLGLDLSTMRETLHYMRDDAKQVSGMERVAVALEAALREVEAAEARSKPVSYTPMASRFLPARR